jgi:hypothetical protein
MALPTDRGQLLEVRMATELSGSGGADASTSGRDFAADQLYIGNRRPPAQLARGLEFEGRNGDFKPMQHEAP